MHLEHCNKMAEAGTRLAHLDGGVPQGRVTVDRIDEYNPRPSARGSSSR